MDSLNVLCLCLKRPPVQDQDIRFGAIYLLQQDTGRQNFKDYPTTLEKWRQFKQQTVRHEKNSPMKKKQKQLLPQDTGIPQQSDLRRGCEGYLLVIRYNDNKSNILMTMTVWTAPRLHSQEHALIMKNFSLPSSFRMTPFHFPRNSPS